MTKQTRKHLLFPPFYHVFILGMALSIISCGYRTVQANLAGGGDRISIPMARNYTSFKGLAGPLTSALRKNMARAGIEVCENDSGAPKLEVEILLIESEPGMLTVTGGNLDAVDSIRGIHARALLVEFDGQILEGPHQFEVAGRAYAGGNPISDEALGQRKLRSLIDDLAQDIVAHFLSK